MNLDFDPNCVAVFQDLKFKKESRFITYKIVKDKVERIVIEHVGAKEKNWDDFLAVLPNDEYRFAVFDLDYVNEDKMNISKILFVFWAPDNVMGKNKMLYSTSKENFKKALSMTKDYVITSHSEYSQADIIKEVSK